MMKLKYLFDNRELAQMLIKNWHYDEDSLEMFKLFRISSNAIYPFKYNSQTNLLRFAPLEEKQEKQILAELDFIAYLHEHEYPCLYAIKSKNGCLLEVQNTPWGKYYASVFERVKGQRMDDLTMDEDMIIKIAKALAHLHKLSVQYKPVNEKRLNHLDCLAWIEGVLTELHTDKKLLQELVKIKQELSELPLNINNYGLIHYDFELDNLFYDELSAQINVIDFDDAMYHWYAMDITQCLESIYEEVTDISQERITELFISTYNDNSDQPLELMEYLPLFKRFAKLYQYARITIALNESWNNEPEWMERLRKYLNERLIEISNSLNC